MNRIVTLIIVALIMTVAGCGPAPVRNTHARHTRQKNASADDSLGLMVECFEGITGGSGATNKKTVQSRPVNKRPAK